MEKYYYIKGFMPFIVVIFMNVFIDIGYKIVMSNIFLFEHSNIVIYSSIILPFLILYPFLNSINNFLSSKIIKLLSLINLFLSTLLFIIYYFNMSYIAFMLMFLMSAQLAILIYSKFNYLKERNINSISAHIIIQFIFVGAIFFSFIVINSLMNKFFIDSINDLIFIAFIFMVLSLLQFIISLFISSDSKINNRADPKTLLKEFFFKRGQYEDKRNVLSNAIVMALTYYLIIFLSNYINLEIIFFIALIGVLCGFLLALQLEKNYIEIGLIPLGIFIILISILFLYLIYIFDLTHFLFLPIFIFSFGASIFFSTLNILNFKNKEINSFVASLSTLLIFILLIVLNSYLIYSVLLGILALSIIFIRDMKFSFIKILFNILLLRKYKIIVQEIEMNNNGILLLGNHTSFVDWAVIQMSFSKKIHFVLQKNIYKKWYLNFFINFWEVIEVSNISNPSDEDIEHTFKTIKSYLEKGEIVCIFPEGGISKHGLLNKFEDDFNLFKRLKEAFKDSSVQPTILPFYIRGLWGSPFSFSNKDFNKNKKKFSNKSISIVFGNYLELGTSIEKVKSIIFNLSFKAWEYQCNHSPTLAKAFIDACKRGKNNIAIIDPISGTMNYTKLLTLCIMISSEIKDLSFEPKEDEETIEHDDFKTNINKDCIGILLPSSLASVIINFSVMLSDKIAVNLNFTNMQSFQDSLIETNISHIYTSRKFLDRLKSKGFKFDLSSYTLHYMEDIVNKIKQEKIIFIINLVLVKFLPSFLLNLLFNNNNDIKSPCVILFSSGSEGKAKGIILSNLNIMSNIYQIIDVIHSNKNDVILSSLPPFHSFGLTVTTFMPIIQNIKSATYPDPTDGIGIAKTIFVNKISIMCASSTLLGIYTRNSNIDKIMFSSLRLVIAGGEKLRSEVRDIFTKKFNKQIYEGYGATETTPVVSVNIPDEFDVENWKIHRGNKEGSVGMPLPGTTIRIINPDTNEELPPKKEGLILIGGHQIMLGYLNDIKRTQNVITRIDNLKWYKSSDKGFLDDDGFLYITDRYSRFAKIGAEMISLGFIEEEISKIIRNTELEHIKYVITNLEDEKKSERLILLIQDEKDDELNKFINLIKKSDIPALFKPSQYFAIDEIPLLGSGKINFKEIKNMALEIQKQLT